MKTTKLLCLAAILLLFMCSTASAGDYATLNFIGFSQNGRYLAFEEYGVQDGSGFPYSNIYFVDVDKNVFAAPTIKISIDRETATEKMARLRAKTAAAAALRRYRIVPGNTGSLVVARLLTDVAVYNNKADSDTQTINFAEIVGSMYRQGDYDLVLKPSEVKIKECEYVDYPIYKLEVLLKDKATDTTTVLQKDASLPVSRACPMSYAVQYIYLYNDRIAVFLNTYHMGFEGPDMRYLAITGKFK